MRSLNNAGQQPRLCIDLNVAYRAEDDDALNDVCSISQISVIADSDQTSFSMSHSTPQAQTSLRAPRAQTIDAGKMVVSIENANQRISVTSSLPSTFIQSRETGSSSSLLATEQRARTRPSYTSWRPESSAASSEVRFAGSGSQSSWLCFDSSSFASSSFFSLNNAGQSGETSEGHISNKKKYPVPVELRKPGETDETRIFGSVLAGRRLVPVPEALRIAGETDQTRISIQALKNRKLVPVPESLRQPDEAPGKLIPRNQLGNRQWVPVPPELRNKYETDDTRIRYSALSYRKRLVSVPEALREPGETEDTKIFLKILQNRKRQREAEQSSAEIKKSKRAE